MTIEEVEDLYLNQGKSIRQIAEIFGVNKGTVDGMLKRFNIPKRNRFDAIDVRFVTTPRKKEEVQRPKKEKSPPGVYTLTNDNWEIKETNLRADRQNVKCLYIDGVRVPSNHKVFFICQKTGKETTKAINNFLQKPGLFSFEANQSFLHKGKKLSKEHVESIRARNSGEKIASYFDFTCPVCLDKFKYRDIQRNRKKKYCSKSCQLVIWATSPVLYQGENKFELAVRLEIEKQGYKVETQKIFGYFPVDCYLPELDIIIQADGVYWHAKPEKYGTDLNKLDENQKRHINSDNRFKTYCKNRGLRYARVWQDDFENNPENEIKEAIKKALSEDRA